MNTPSRLKAWLASREWSAADLAAKLKLNHPSQVHGWLAGTSRPPVWARSAIEDLTDRLVRSDDWLSDDERARLAAVRAR